MKKFSTLVLITALVIIVSCSKKTTPTQDKATATVPEKPATTYVANIKSLIETKCSPCHIPSGGGRKAALDNYGAAKTYIDEIITRIKLNPADRGFMPFKHEKLSQEEIAVFVNWKDGGLKEN